MKARGFSFAAGLAGFAWAGPALAHAGEAEPAWSSWALTPEVVIPTLLVAAVYAAGVARRRGAATTGQWERHGLFFAGVAAVFLSLASPVDPMAERLFWVHQIQHLLLRMLGPMLITLAWPAGLLTAGLPRAVRQTVLAPTVSNPGVRGLFGFLSHPVTATALFIAALYVWQIPALHDLALENEGVHDTMHLTMLAAGLLFWQRIFDRRPGPSPLDMTDGLHGLGYGARLMMLWVVALSNIVLGSFTTLKTVALYAAYGTGLRPGGITPLQDEQAGGFIIWMPSSMMCLIAILVIIHWWGVQEGRLEQRRRAAMTSGSNAAALLWPTTAAALIEQARPRNRRLALGVGAFALTVFFTAIFVGVMATQPRAPDPGAAPLRAPVQQMAHSGAGAAGG